VDCVRRISDCGYVGNQASEIRNQKSEMENPMFQNYLKVALRNLRKYKGYSFINILGLAVGMACCFLIMLYVRFELSYEDFHANKNQIYRVIPRWMNNGVEMAQVWTPTGLAPDVAAQFSEIKAAARYVPWDGEALMHFGERVFPRERLALADQAFLEMFSFELLKGNPQTALQAPFALMISESIAKSAFADEEPLGKIIRFDDKHDFIVTGVFKDIPANSHLQFSYLASFVTLKNFMAGFDAAENVLQNYASWNYSTYLWIPRPLDRKDFERRMTAFVEEKSGNKSRTTTFTLQPLADIHFTQGLRGDSANGDITYVYAFSGVAAFILLIACFNFMNLATARALNRTKEVGVRKVVGAFRWQLMMQFLFEKIFDRAAIRHRLVFDHRHHRRGRPDEFHEKQQAGI
jgi:putative ABC transport system permease protein